MTSLHIIALSTALCLALPAPLAWAQGTSVGFGSMTQDTSLPVEVSADNLAVNQSNGSATFTGHVVIGQGEMRLSAPNVLVLYTKDSSKIARLKATGGVTLVNGEDAAEARSADYDIDAGTIVMQGDVLLTQGANALSSQNMTVNLKDGTARMSGQVKTVLQTGGK